MRRFSQRNSLVTLNEINITPLLDLAFVLLIIFVISSPLLEQSLQLNLPTGGAENSAVRKDEVRTIEVGADAKYVMKGKGYTLGELERELAALSKADPKLAIYIRADKKESYENVFNLLELCRKLNIKKIDFAASPQRRGR
jgi:biopolymer transport protein ExbD